MKACQFPCELLAICLTRTRYGARVVCITLRPSNCNLPKRILLLNLRRYSLRATELRIGLYALRVTRPVVMP
jgi:hypothetical protein